MTAGGGYSSLVGRSISMLRGGLRRVEANYGRDKINGFNSFEQWKYSSKAPELLFSNNSMEDEEEDEAPFQSNFLFDPSRRLSCSVPGAEVLYDVCSSLKQLLLVSNYQIDRYR